MRVLVTGASGFIGGVLAARLAGRGDVVHAVSRRAVEADGVLTWHRADLGDRDDVRRLLDEVEPEGIVHLAGFVSGGRGPETSHEAWRVTLGSTVHLLELIAERLPGSAIRRLVVAGSLEEPLPGAAEPPASPYAVAKEAARSWARLAFTHWGVPVVWARLFMVYGPGQRDWKKVVPATCQALLAGRAPRASSGRRPVDWIHVDDVVAGLMTCLDRAGIEGSEPELGSGRLVTVREVVEYLHALVPGAPSPLFGALPDRAHEVVRAARFEPTRTLLDWAPTIGLEAGLAATLEWVRHAQRAAQE